MCGQNIVHFASISKMYHAIKLAFIKKNKGSSMPHTHMHNIYILTYIYIYTYIYYVCFIWLPLVEACGLLQVRNTKGIWLTVPAGEGVDWRNERLAELEKRIENIDFSYWKLRLNWSNENRTDFRKHKQRIDGTTCQRMLLPKISLASSWGTALPISLFLLKLYSNVFHAVIIKLSVAKSFPLITCCT